MYIDLLYTVRVQCDVTTYTIGTVRWGENLQESKLSTYIIIHNICMKITHYSLVYILNKLI